MAALATTSSKSLLDELHGSGKAPGAPPAPESDAIDDSEFGALLDQLYGTGNAPGQKDDENADAAQADTAKAADTPAQDACRRSTARQHHAGDDKIGAGARADPRHAGPQARLGHGRSAESGGGRLGPSRRNDRARGHHAPGLAGQRRRRTDSGCAIAWPTCPHAAWTRPWNGPSTSWTALPTTCRTPALRMRMQPIGRLFQRFPRIIRDLARQLGKDVELVHEGEETNLDRTLVESLADPLIHLLRNAVDHGLEDPTDRESDGKPRKGTVRLSAGQEGERIIIRISDDGRGMNPDVLRRKAVEKRLARRRTRRAAGRQRMLRADLRARLQYA